jgi:hypothetical protein
MPNFLVAGIVSSRDNQPYIQLSNEKGMIAQLTMSEARIIAQDILVMASRTEADAMIVKFFDNMEFPKEAAVSLLQEFRDFRHELDSQQLQRSVNDSDTGKNI